MMPSIMSIANICMYATYVLAIVMGNSRLMLVSRHHADFLVCFCVIMNQKKNGQAILAYHNYRSHPCIKHFPSITMNLLYKNSASHEMLQ